MTDFNDRWKIWYLTLRRSKAKYSFYNGDFSYRDFNNSKIAMQLPRSRVDWSARAVDIRSNKTVFDRFENDTIGLNSVIDKYHLREALDKLKPDVLIAGVGFLAISGNRIMPFTAMEATGNFNWYDQNLNRGVAVYNQNAKLNSLDQIFTPSSWVEYLPDKTIVYEDEEIVETANPTNRPLIAMLTHKATTSKPFGHSVIKQTARDAVIDGSRTARQAMIAAYHYNTKVDVILGADNETSLDVIERQAGDIVKVGTNDNGQIPQIGEFAQHVMGPFNETMLLAARNFCAATKLNLYNLGLDKDAPQGPDALEIMGDDLRDDIIKWQGELSQQLKYFAVTLYMYDQGLSEIDAELQAKIDAIEASWLPVFRVDVAKFGDGLTKIAQEAKGIVRQRSIWRNLGLRSKEIDNVIESISEDIVDNI